MSTTKKPDATLLDAEAPSPDLWDNDLTTRSAAVPILTNDPAANRRTSGWSQPNGTTPSASVASVENGDTPTSRPAVSPAAPAPDPGMRPTAAAGLTAAFSGEIGRATLAGTGAPAANADQAGVVIADRYRIIKKIGEGGMGVVYLAEHILIEKKVALKVLSEDFARKADLVQRFMQEAKAASRIGHENIVDITDFGETPSGSVFFAMEFLDGKDLATHIREGGPMNFDRARKIMLQICRGLGAAHGKGIIHRDMKPENIYLIEREGRADFVKILDFGIAKMNSLDEGSSRLTRTGMIFGTPEYMSPEQARGDRPDHRVDIYAVGCILYEMLTGDVPFRADTFMGVLTKHMFEQPPPLSLSPQLGVPADVEAVVMKALSKDRDQRFQTMKELSVGVAACGGHNPAEGWGDEPSQVMHSDVVYGPGRNSTVRSAVPRDPSVQTRLPASVPEQKPKSSPVALILLLLVVFVGGGGGATWWFGLRKPPAPPPVTVVNPIVEPPKVKVETPPAKPTSVTLSIKSEPDKAEVRRNGEILGSTPGAFTFPFGEKPITVTLKKTGFKDLQLEVSPDKERDYMVSLIAAKSKGSSRPSSHERKPKEKETAVSTPPPSSTPPATATKKPANKLRDLKDPFATP